MVKDNRRKTCIKCWISKSILEFKKIPGISQYSTKCKNCLKERDYNIKTGLNEKRIRRFCLGPICRSQKMFWSRHGYRLCKICRAINEGKSDMFSHY